MCNFFGKIPPILENFLAKFQSLFSKPTFISFSLYFSGLFLELKRTSIQSIALRNFYARYENLQYFLSEAKWDEKELNDHRIEILESNHTTKTCSSGVLIIDDSSCKKWGLKTEGAKKQYSSTEDRVINCNVGVVSAYADKNKQYPVNLKPYIPEDDSSLPDSRNPSYSREGSIIAKEEHREFKSKIDLAKDLIEDALQKNLKFSDVLFDSWYFANHFVKFLEEKGLSWISEAKENRVISFQRKLVYAHELVKLIPSAKYRNITVSTTNGKKKKFWIYSFRARVKGIPHPLLVVVSIGHWSKEDPKNVHIYVTNHLALNGEEVVQRYAMRWSIECIFRDLKENVCFDHYQVRNLKAITRHWYLSFLAYTFLLYCKLNGTFSKIFHQKPETIGEQLELFRIINSIHQADWIKQNYELYQKFLENLKPSRRDD